MMKALMSRISFIYFDLGGVMALDFSGTNRWNDLKKELGIKREKWDEFDKFWDEHEPAICIGQNAEEMIPLIKEKFAAKIPKNYSLLENGFIGRFEVNRSIWPVVEYTRKNFRIGLLTNMYPGMLAAIKKHGLIPNINWDVVIDSSLAGMQKPDEDIFKLAQKLAETRNKEILFVENTKKHIEAAKRFGWQTFLYDPTKPEDSSKRLEAYIRGNF